MLPLLRLFIIVALILPATALAELEVSDAWIKNLPPSVPVRAGYMTLHNNGQSTVVIRGARSAAFASVEIHRSVMQDGMMQMEPVESLEIPAGATLQLKPGGYHLMMHIIEATRPGQEIELVLQFSDGSSQQLTMTVLK